MIFGYARVSTDGQSIEAQVRQLRAAGADKVFREVASGAKTDRAQLRRLIAHLSAGDVVLVARVDRLARSTRDLLNTLAAITVTKEAAFRSLGEGWADTTTPGGRLMLTFLGGIAEFERELIRSRTGEGRARAKRNGIRFGRPSKLSPDQRRDLLRRLEAGEKTRSELARIYGVHPSTISRLANPPSIPAAGRWPAIKRGEAGVVGGPDPIERRDLDHG